LTTDPLLPKGFACPLSQTIRSPFTCALQARRETVYFLAKTTCYDRLHEATGLLAALAPDVHEAILAASAPGPPT
jgi:hypothetical protein